MPQQPTHSFAQVYLLQLATNILHRRQRGCGEVLHCDGPMGTIHAYGVFRVIVNYCNVTILSFTLLPAIYIIACLIRHPSNP
jgi:hypothetical protein